MAFWGEDEWQKEIDFLAMNGVNLVLDITGMEEVYRRFLTKLGYRHREIKNFISGPAYFAWFYMNNIYGIGGPLHDGFFAEKTELARKNHFRMKTLGMNVVLQAYTGMVPGDINKKDKDVPVIPQGRWNNLPRPLVVSPDSVSYVKYASLFYESQKEVFGDLTHYYAGDICHEGGTLGKAKAKDGFLNVMHGLLSADKDAVWVVQSWGDNPTRKFTKYLKPYRDDHILMLDLYAERSPNSEGRFAKLSKFNYLFGFLNSFGGRNGIYGNLDTLAGQIKSSSEKPNFKGIAYTAESNNVNPIMIDLFHSTVWDEISDIDEWIKSYCIRRYGKENENLYKAALILKETALCGENIFKQEGQGAPECAVCSRPESGVASACTWGYTNIHYSAEKFDEAVRLFLTDYDKFKDNECYVFDAVDLLRQSLSNRINNTLKSMMSSYKTKDYFAFTEYADKFTSLSDMLDRVLLNHKDWSLSSYLGRVKEYSDKLDDFTRELYMINAKALITTWYSRPASDRGELHEYANRQLGDLISSFYKTRWDKFIENVKIEMDGGKPAPVDWFKLEWDFVLSDTKFTEKVREDSLKALGKQILDK